MISASENTSKTFNPLFLKNWFLLFLFTLGSFSFYIIEFLWGNHDWGWIKEQTPLLSGIFEGRFSQFILQTVLTDGYILPILTLIISFGFYTLGITLLLNLLGLKDKKLPLISIYYIVVILCFYNAKLFIVAFFCGFSFLFIS